MMNPEPLRSDDIDLFPDISVATDEQLRTLADGFDEALEPFDGDAYPDPIATLSDNLQTARFVSREKDVHRVLTAKSQGADAEALQRATLRRLASRGIDREVATSGYLHKTDLESIDTALHFLGAMSSTVDASSISIGAQEMIRHPGNRNSGQLSRARARMDALIKERDEREKEKPKPQSSGAVESRKRACNAFALAYRHASSVHYTQGPLRWQGIRNRLYSSKGQYPNYCDCSSLFTWAWWTVIGNRSDILNGAGWSAGFTGTLASHGRRLSSPILGCAVLYGGGWPYSHVSMYVGGGYCLSHGSEIGPLKVPYNYRPVAQLRGYV